jgi:hypothetical protein
VDGKGKFLDEIVPAPLRPQAPATYDQCRNHQCLIYTIASTTDRAGREVHYERLLLPFSDGGNAVDHIVASLHLISIEGNFVRDNILGNATAGVRYLTASMIQPGFGGRR